MSRWWRAALPLESLLGRLRGVFATVDPLLVRMGLGGIVARQASVLAGGTAAAQALTILASPILTRFYGPREFGAAGLFAALVNMAMVVVTLRYELAIPSAEDDGEADSLLALALCALVPLSIALSAVLWVMMRAGLPSLEPLPRLAALLAAPAFAASGGFAALRFWAVRQERYGEVARLSIVQGLGRAVGPIALAPVPLGTYALMIGEFLGRAAGSWRLFQSALPGVWRALTPQRNNALRRTARKHWRMPVISMPSSLVDVLASSLPVLLVADLFGARNAGLFVLVQRVIFLPTMLIGTSVADVFHVRFSTAMQRGTDDLSQLIRSTALRLLLIGAAFLVPAAIFSPLSFGTIFGPNWAGAGLLVTVMAPWSLAALAVSPVSRVLIVARRNQSKLLYDGFSIAAVFAALIGGSRAGWGFLGTVALMSGLQAVSYLVYFATIMRAARLGRPTRDTGEA